MTIAARKSIRNRRQKAGLATHILRGLTVDEVSIVDYPANNRPWSVVKNARKITKTEDGRRVVTEVTANQAMDGDAATDNPATGGMAKDAGDRFGLLLAGIESKVAKALDVNERARSTFENSLPMIFSCLDNACNLMYGVEGTPFRGSLDEALGGELATVAGHLMTIAMEFGVTEIPVAEDEPVPVLAAKAHYMGKRRMQALVSAVLRLQEMLAEMGCDLAEYAEAEASTDIDKSSAAVAPEAQPAPIVQPEPAPVTDAAAATADASTDMISQVAKQVNLLVDVIASVSDRMAAIEHQLAHDLVQDPLQKAESRVRRLPTVVSHAGSTPAPAPRQPVQDNHPPIPFGRDPVR